jgi:hypothetical protein
VRPHERGFDRCKSGRARAGEVLCMRKGVAHIRGAARRRRFGICDESWRVM